ncbi:MAG: NPCBM/NEW2 domain-containing protein [Clostridia bacterium]|nr:NPCBM/NEW2 domain-containing protein [Clostridia bacterium]
MKRILAVILVLAVVLSPGIVSYAEDDLYISLDGQWAFAYDEDGSLDAETLELNDTITVPAAMELEGYGYPSYYFEEERYWGMQEDDGVHSRGIYEKTFDAESAGNAFLVFDSAEDYIEVYFNEERIGESANGKVGAIFEVQLKKGENIVRAVVTRDKSGINKADNFALSGLVGSVFVTSESPYEEAQSKNVEIKDGKLLIDGSETVLRGVKYTPTDPENGDAIGSEQIEKDIALIKEYGFNAVWTSAAPDCFYELAGEAGLYVIDEVNIYLDNVRENAEAAAERAAETVKQHKKYDSIIMRSAGYGDNADQSVISAIESEDERPIVQSMAAQLADEKEVFGATGGFADWAATLGNGNIGGFIKEFADKELYTTRNLYTFETTDKITGTVLTIDGEITNYQGAKMLGEGEFENTVKELDAFSIVTYIAGNEDRVIFESSDGLIKFEIKNYRLSLTMGDDVIDTSFDGGLAAAIYADGEAQLFKNESFAKNMETEGSFCGTYTAGAGGDSAIQYIKIYDKALRLDDLLLESAENNLVSDVEFEEITVLEDRSYQYLGYGGDFGDDPNSYYKSLKGLFSSLREPHPEAEEVKALFMGAASETAEIAGEYIEEKKVEISIEDGAAVFTAENASARVNEEGAIESYVFDGREQLEEAMYPATKRLETLDEYFYDDWFMPYSFEVEDDTLYVELADYGEKRLYLAYSMTEDGVLHVSMQTDFGKNEVKPTFVGFYGKSAKQSAAWLGYGEESRYPDRNAAGEYGEFEMKIEDMADNYSVVQENGNREAYVFSLCGEDVLTFTAATANPLQCAAWNYDPYTDAEKVSEAEKEKAAYFRIGGYIAGLSEGELSENRYGFAFDISGERKTGITYYNAVTGIEIDGEELSAFAPEVYTYVYRTSATPEVTVSGFNTEVSYFDGGCIVSGGGKEYTIYFVEKDVYLSDMEANESGEIARDNYFGSGSFMLGGDWQRGEENAEYQKGLAMKAGSEITFDVSGFENNTFTAVIGKNEMQMQQMGGGFDRGRFDAQCDVEIYLDGELAYKAEGISMFSGRRSVSLDVSEAKELKIVVLGSGNEESTANEDAVIADAKITPRGARVLSEKRDGTAVEAVIFNPDSDEIGAALSYDYEGEASTALEVIGRENYKTIRIEDVPEGAEVELVVSGQ